jgi:N-acetylneuraminic acid mutarotase
MKFLTNRLVLVTSLLIALSGCASTSTTALLTSQNEPVSLEEARYAHAMVNDGEKLYVIGGSKSRNFLSSIEIIDPKTKESIKLNGKIIPRRYFSAVWDGKESIYIVGGVSLNGDRFKYEKKVEVFNTRTHEVTLAKNLPEPTRTNSAVFKDGKIFVFGGGYPRAGTSKYHSTVAVYNTSNDSWQRGTNMPTAKATKAFIKDDYIYLVGGYNGKQSLNVFERYDPKLNRWESLPAIPYRISAHSLALKDDKLYVFGSYLDTSATFNYDFKTHQWQKSDIGYIAARHTAATIMDDVIYVSGGITSSAGSSSIDNIQVFNF